MSLVTIYVLMICNVKCYGWICSVANILLPCNMISLLGDLIYLAMCCIVIDRIYMYLGISYAAPCSFIY